MELKCSFDVKSFYNNEDFYTCNISLNEITKHYMEIEQIYGEHLNGKTNADVNVLFIHGFLVNTLPTGLIKIFPNIIGISGILAGFFRENRTELKNLEILEVKIVCSKFTTFQDYLSVKYPMFNFQFDYKKIENDSSESLTPFKFFNSPSDTNKTSIFGHCLKTKSVETFQSSHRSYELLQNNLNSHQKNAINNYEQLFLTGNFSDFVIIVNKEKQFQVHKIILAAQSKGFAEMFQGDPNANEMKFEDLREEVVEKFIRYLYTGKLPENNESSMEIFELASKMKVLELKNAMEKIVLTQLDEENAWKVFLLAHKYKSSQLKRAAFNEIKKKFPDRKLPDEMTEDFSSVQQIIELKLKIDAVLAKVSKLKM